MIKPSEKRIVNAEVVVPRSMSVVVGLLLDLTLPDHDTIRFHCFPFS